jgi:4-oxalomesaconate tautomerase
MVNSRNVCEVVIRTPGGAVTYDGDARIDGVPGTAAPVMINFLDTAGSTCGALLPTGNIVDTIEGVPCTLIDNGMPVVVMDACRFGRTGYEDRAAMNADKELKAAIEKIRLKAGPMMNLGDVTDKVVPKMCLIAPPKDGGAVTTRCFIPHDCHATIGVLAAVTIATACALPGSVAGGIAVVPEGASKLMSVEHPTGEVTVGLELEDGANAPVVRSAALLRTTRRMMEGFALVPASVWDGGIGLARRAAE